MISDNDKTHDPGESNAPLENFSSSVWEAIGFLLRDFFTVSKSERHAQIVIKLSEYCGSQVTLPIAPHYTDWTEVEYEFNRLFIGPMALLAPPYASVYIESEPQLMGSSTLEIRQLYYALGLSVFSENRIPDDHLSYEIELCLLLTQQTPRQPVYHEALVWLVNGHMNRWLPLFIELVRHKAQTPLIVSVADVLLLWFCDLQRRTSL